MNQRELRGRWCTYYRSLRRWRSRQRWFSQTKWLAEFGVLAFSCHVGADDVVRCICGRSRMCMTMMILRDLPHTCTCTWCCIQWDSGNKIMDLLVLRTRELWNLFKLNFTLTMRLTLAILGWPPGRALFNVKSRTLKVLTMVFCWWELNIVTMATPLFFFFFFIESKMQELTPIRRQDMDWERTYFGHSHTSPTLGVCKTSSVWSSSFLL